MSYLRVYLSMFRNAVSTWSQYRFDTALQVGMNIIWFGLQFIFLEVVFSRTPEIHGWNKEMMWLLFVTFPFLDLVFRMLVGNSMWYIPERIVRGELDTFLIKPKSALFLLITERLQIKHFLSFPLHVSLFTMAFLRAVPEPSFLLVSQGIFLFLGGVGVLFSVQLVIVSLGFWFPRIDNLLEVWYVLLESPAYPGSVFPSVIYYLFSTLVPVLFVAFFPAAAFLGVLSGKMLLYAGCMSVGFLIASVAFWHIAIEYYSSASS